ncbi:hypothetical protein MML48_4g00017527 [Holotrichia oblita]|uniref:Uncharacterized protein n=1 Tax=Holotrichia oblita TaxID=644536 RepID=A0ACB9T7D0_HOLOL|nr:hypothetical protein MML48_4g00017527 [Holotrichia oblita]
MKVVALISGGKDSCFNMMQCIAAGHEIVALANLRPYAKTEIDSYMYQSVGYEAIDLIAQALDLPLFRIDTHGTSYQQGKTYAPTENDEVEDLFSLLRDIRNDINYEAVSVGAILSDYQRVRVENVCIRLNIIPLAYLWRREQAELLEEMIKCEIDAIIIKVAALGLEPTRHLGRSLRLVEPHLLAMHEKYGLNVCGKVANMKHLQLTVRFTKVEFEESETIIHSDDSIAPVGYLKLNKMKLELKLPSLDLQNRLNGLPLKDSDGYVTDYGEEAIDLVENELHEEVPTDDDAQVENVILENKEVYQDINSVKSANGWLLVGGIHGTSENPSEAIKEAMDKLKYELTSKDHRLQNICSINMYISNMSQFAELNRLYSEVLNHVNPPTRACVEVPLPSNCPVILEAISWNGNITANATGDLQTERHTMHVQSVSHWAPACIGPYSQVVKVEDLIHLAGQIALVPGSMQMVNGGIKQQCKLSLRHVGRLLKAMDPNLTIRDVVQGICYVSKAKYIEIANKYWEECTNNSIMDYVVVSKLPRNALVEWHVWAHTHNNQFEYEETGKCIENWSISIYRRWNYENNIAAIVCHVDHNEHTETKVTSGILKEAVSYVLTKLQQGHEYDPNSICCLKFFYSVKRDIPTQDLFDIIAEIRNTVQLAYTVIPVLALKSENTYLSICGVRNQ